jgi:hypothetical protein
MKKDKKTKERKFKSTQQNISIPQSSGYFASYYTKPTIRSREFSEPRILSGFSVGDSFGLESKYPEVASDSFILQLPKPHLEIKYNERMAYNQRRNII